MSEVKVEEGVEQSETSRYVATEVHPSKSADGADRFPGQKRVVHDASTMPRQTPTAGDRPRSYKHSGLVRCFFWSAAFIFTAAVSATLGAALTLLDPLSPILAPLRSPDKQQADLPPYGFESRLMHPIDILIMGIDRVPGVPPHSQAAFSGRSDTMLLLRLDPTPPSPPLSKGGSVKLLSIPRDTRVEIPGTGMAKINQANVNGGAALAARVVSHHLNNVRIDRYVRLTTGAFRELVDLVGGIEVFVPQRMYYADATQNLKIDLQPGWQTLNGDQAEQFVRFRDRHAGDLGRVQRQQALLKSLHQRLRNPSVQPRLPQIVQVMWKYVDTNLSLEEARALVNFGLSVDRDDANMVILPGRFSAPREYAASYWIMDSAAKDRVMQEYFQQESAIETSSASRSPSQVRIAVQNSTSNPQAGSNMAEYLASKGFKNVYLVADWPDLQRQTQIIVQQGDMQAANTLKKVLGLGKIEASSTGDLASELTIRVGEDWIDREF